jgi:hypothetical protein
MWQAFRHIEQIARDENPIRVMRRHDLNNIVMSWVITVKVQVCEMDGPTTSEKGMSVS